jgi:hypothetical protein
MQLAALRAGASHWYVNVLPAWCSSGDANGDALEAAIKKSGKKAPVFQKLLTRLHVELRFPLTATQAKKIKVDPWILEGVPGGGAASLAAMWVFSCCVSKPWSFIVPSL